MYGQADNCNFAYKNRKNPDKIRVFLWLYLFCSPLMVEATGLEPTASASRTQRSTKLSHASICSVFFFLLCFCFNLLLRSALPDQTSPLPSQSLACQSACCGHSLLLAFSAPGSARNRPQTEPRLDMFCILFSAMLLF